MNTLHLVSHTHWDREWYQTFQQFRLRLVRLVDNLLEILDTDPRYAHFMLDGQMIVLEDYLQVRPQREADLRAYVQCGRIGIGPWYILPDEFLVSPEATVRNLLEGDRVARRFGSKMLVGYEPDAFGHIGQLPQILRGFGIARSAVMRGLADEPCEFWWQSPDGSQVLMSYLVYGYGNAAGILNAGLEGFVVDAAKQRDMLKSRSASDHLLLMNGVDHQEAHGDTSAALANAAGRLDGDMLIHSSLSAYFEALEASLDGARLPVFTGEMRNSKRHPLLPGVLSTRIWIKQRNRACETLLERWAEPFSAWAGQVSTPGGVLLRQPQDVLRQAWRLLMQCHPHDSICGCSIDQVHDEMRPRFDQVEQMGEEITRQSLQALSAKVDTRPPEGQKGVVSSVVVYNPTSQPRSDTISVVLETSGSAQISLLDEDGNPIPYQMMGLGSKEIFNMIMSPKEFGDSLGMASGGVIMSWKVIDLRISRDGGLAKVEMLLSETSPANLVAWERGIEAIQKLVHDHTVTGFQILARSAEENQVRFTTPEVPGNGYRTIWVRETAVETRPPMQMGRVVKALMPLTRRIISSQVGQRLAMRLAPDPSRKPPFKIENEYFSVEAQADGTLDVLDRRSGLLYKGQNRLIDGGDRGDEYNFSPPAVDQLVSARVKGARVERGDGPQVLEIELELETPRELSADRKNRSAEKVKCAITSRVTLARGVPRIDIHTEVNNLARDHRLRAHFPTPFGVAAAGAAQYDGHFEVISRPLALPKYDETWVEQPRPETSQRAFTAVAGEQAALLVANRGLPEAEVLRKPDGSAEIAITLLRCVGWLSRDDYPERKGHAGPYMATPGAQLPGRWAFDYSIVPHAPADALAAYHQAYAFEAPMRAVSAGLHEGLLPPASAFLQAEPAQFTVSAVKAAEDGRGWVARGYNLTGEALTVTLRSELPFTRVEQVNMAEETLAEITPAADGSVSLPVGGWQVITLRFW